ASRRRHTRSKRDWSSDVCSSDLRGTRLSLFDEPEAGIDLWSFTNLIAVFEKMYEQINGSILIFSHQERILEIADKIVVIAAGRKIGRASCRERAEDGGGSGAPKR